MQKKRMKTLTDKLITLLQKERNLAVDMTDIGNTIGICIASHFDKDNSKDDFITGLEHGISLINKTHEKK